MESLITTNSSYFQTGVDESTERFSDQVLEVLIAPHGKPFRRIVRRSNQKPTGKYPSIKTGLMVQWESIPERNAFRVLDACPDVLWFSSQSVRIKYRMNGELREHYPDILVERSGRREFYEVKTQKFAITPDILERTILLTRELPKLGYLYKVLIAEKIAAEPRFSTITQLIEFGRTPVSLMERQEILAHFNERTALSWGAIIDGDSKVNVESASRLILDGYLCLDWSLPLNRNTIIYLAHNLQSNIENSLAIIF